MVAAMMRDDLEEENYEKRGQFITSCLALMVLMTVALVGCGSNNNTSTNATEAPATTATTEPAAKKPTVAFVYIGPPGMAATRTNMIKDGCIWRRSWGLKLTL